MNIIHYTLGLYPKRTGGLNRYATDLMLEQSKKHNVSVIMPGKWQPWRFNCFLYKDGRVDRIMCYKLGNALPSPLLYGIRYPSAFYHKGFSRKSFERFYETVKPDILHLHTLMGLPEDALAFFKDKGVRIVYTSHDYFGICPKVNLINSEGELCEGPAPERCAVCNRLAPSTIFLRIRNSELAFMIRDLLKWTKSTLNF